MSASAAGVKNVSEQRTLESIVDPFVKRIGGERIAEIVGNSNPQSSADYLFKRHHVIAELKSLQAGSFAEPFRRKMEDLMGRWQREGKLIVFGTTRLNSNQLSEECREEMFSVMAESLQKHVVAASNAQIKNTKKLLNLPDARGLLWVASDGNEFLQPNMVWYLLHRILKKKRRMVTRLIQAFTASRTSAPGCSGKFLESQNRLSSGLAGIVRRTRNCRSVSMNCRLNGRNMCRGLRGYTSVMLWAKSKIYGS